jgi:transposase-like protein
MQKTCPYYNNSNTIAYGLTKLKLQQWRCKDCIKKFSSTTVERLAKYNEA